MNSWSQLLHESGFETSRVTNGLTQDRCQEVCHPWSATNEVEFGVVAFKHGKQHYLDRESGYKLIDCSFSRNDVVIDTIPSAYSRLNRGGPGTCGPGKNVRQTEKNVDLISEEIVTYCPEGGLVYDPYGGTLSTAIAAIRMRRNCVVVECQTECFNLAMERLGKIAVTSLKNSARAVCRPHPVGYHETQKKSSSSSRPSTVAEITTSTGIENKKRKAETAVECEAANCLRPSVLLSHVPTRCSGHTGESRCPAQLHDLCDYAKQNQTDKQEKEGLYDGIGFCSKRCFGSVH